MGGVNLKASYARGHGSSQRNSEVLGLKGTISVGEHIDRLASREPRVQMKLLGVVAGTPGTDNQGTT